jgi:hypothetical protein
LTIEKTVTGKRKNVLLFFLFSSPQWGDHFFHYCISRLVVRSLFFIIWIFIVLFYSPFQNLVNAYLFYALLHILLSRLFVLSCSLFSFKLFIHSCALFCYSEIWFTLFSVIHGFVLFFFSWSVNYFTTSLLPWSVKV